MKPFKIQCSAVNTFNARISIYLQILQGLGSANATTTHGFKSKYLVSGPMVTQSGKYSKKCTARLFPAYSSRESTHTLERGESNPWGRVHFYTVTLLKTLKAFRRSIWHVPQFSASLCPRLCALLPADEKIFKEALDEDFKNTIKKVKTIDDDESKKSGCKVSGKYHQLLLEDLLQVQVHIIKQYPGKSLSVTIKILTSTRISYLTRELIWNFTGGLVL